MNFKINQILPEGLVLEEEIAPEVLDLETEVVKFPFPIRLKANISKITNAITVELDIQTIISFQCSRCLDEFKRDFKKHLKLNYAISSLDETIDLNPEIREEIILDYPIKLLCQPDCKGLCPKCGKNLNEGKCSCNYK